MLGHKNISMTLRYAHLAPGRLREAVGVLDRVFSVGRPPPSGGRTAIVAEMSLRRSEKRGVKREREGSHGVERTPAKGLTGKANSGERAP